MESLHQFIHASYQQVARLTAPYHTTLTWLLSFTNLVLTKAAWIAMPVVGYNTNTHIHTHIYTHATQICLSKV